MRICDVKQNPKVVLTHLNAGIWGKSKYIFHHIKQTAIADFKHLLLSIVLGTINS